LKDKFWRTRVSGRYAIVAALILAIGVPSVAVGFGEGRAILGGKRNPSRDATKAFSAETEIIANNTTYGTRQSNKRDGDGGGAIYGCRSNPGNEPCVRANNLKGGRAFEFETVGKEAGAIDVGDPTAAPFSTNATGKVTNLNADKLDGKDSTEFAASGDLLFAQVKADGTLDANNRGATAAALSNATTSTFTVTFNRDVSKCSYTATATGTDAAAGAVFAVSAGSDAKTVVVDEEPAGSTAAPFQLHVIC
jgi:hypothetical protein